MKRLTKVQLKTNRKVIKKSFKKKESNRLKINSQILAPFIRIVGNDIDSKIISLDKALSIARSKGLDLVEISPKADPPVCKVIDYKKFVYDQKKKQKAIKQKAQKIIIKEIRFGPNTGEHDFDFKLKHAQKFLQEGAKVKAFVFFQRKNNYF